MALFKRILNLWRLSAFQVHEVGGEEKLVKDIPTIKSKQAIIIKEEKDIFDDGEDS